MHKQQTRFVIGWCNRMATLLWLTSFFSFGISLVLHTLGVDKAFWAWTVHLSPWGWFGQFATCVTILSFIFSLILSFLPGPPGKGTIPGFEALSEWEEPLVEWGRKLRTGLHKVVFIIAVVVGIPLCIFLYIYTKINS